MSVEVVLISAAINTNISTASSLQRMPRAGFTSCLPDDDAESGRTPLWGSWGRRQHPIGTQVVTGIAARNPYEIILVLWLGLPEIANF